MYERGDNIGLVTIESYRETGEAESGQVEDPSGTRSPPRSGTAHERTGGPYSHTRPNERYEQERSQCTSGNCIEEDAQEVDVGVVRGWCRMSLSSLAAGARGNRVKVFPFFTAYERKRSSFEWCKQWRSAIWKKEREKKETKC